MSSELRRNSKRTREQLTFSDTYGVLDNLRAYDFDLVGFYVAFSQYIDRTMYESKPENSLIFKNNDSLYRGFNLSRNRFYRLLKIAYECGLVDMEKGSYNRNIYILNDEVPFNKLKKIREWKQREKGQNEENNMLSGCLDSCLEKGQLVVPNQDNQLSQKGTTSYPKSGQHINISNIINNSNSINSQSVSQSINNIDKKEKEMDGQTDLNQPEMILLKDFKEILERCELKHIDDRYKDAVEQALRKLYFSDSRLTIGDNYIPPMMVREDMKKLNNLTIQHAIKKFKAASEQREIKHTVAYLKSCIYNSISEMNADVDADLRYKGII